MTILVFDENYNILGTLTLNNILKGLEPKEKVDSPISEGMVPAKFFVEPGVPYQ
jgi:hypothetical protein